MKRVVSISLGTSKRDKVAEAELLGETYRLERIGTDGDMARYAQLFRELDGKVDCLGVGGADIWLQIEDRKYAFKEIERLISGAKVTPVVDGGGLKHTLERKAIERLTTDGIFPLSGKKVLLVSAVDRFGMAQALSVSGASVVYGDFLFGIGIPVPVRSYAAVRRLGAVLLPIITRLPFKWFYPTGEKQEKRTPRFASYFLDADLICGDWHYIRRFMPDSLPGTTILTQTLRKADLEFLKAAGVRAAITTTPVVGGETFATNVMQGVVVAHLGKRPEEITEAEYLSVLEQLDWKPNIIDLN